KMYWLQKGDDRIQIADPSKLSAEDQKKVEVEEIAMGGAEVEDETVSFAVVYDVWRGTDQKLLLKYKALSDDGAKHGELKRKWAGAPDAAAFEAWKKAHALTKTASRKGPKGGAAAITVKLEGEGVAPAAWKRNTLSWRVDNS